jgi:hypothetical protein
MKAIIQSLRDSGAFGIAGIVGLVLAGASAVVWIMKLIG